jgi:hypothetical protein
VRVEKLCGKNVNTGLKFINSQQLHIGTKIGGADMEKYKNSEYQSIKDFLLYNSGKTEWTDEDIMNRTKMLADLSYKKIWT